MNQGQVKSINFNRGSITFDANNFIDIQIMSNNISDNHLSLNLE